MKNWMIVLLIFFLCVGAYANRQPIADAGLVRYASEPYIPPSSGIEFDGTVVLDGTGSYDRDVQDQLTYQWNQVSGPNVIITNETSATPTISGFTQTGSIQECEFELVVSDGELISEPDIVKVVIVPDFSGRTMALVNSTFDPDKPTMFYFGSWSSFPYEWRENANLIELAGAFIEPSQRYGDMLIVYLSSVAPNYNKAIQILGFSGGGVPATRVGTHINTAYTDRRYSINRVTLHDSITNQSEVAAFLNSGVEREQCWVDNYIAWFWEHPGALNVSFSGYHDSPVHWYIISLDPATYTTGDIYNNGLVAGAYFSVFGPGKNLQLAPGPSKYYFKWVGPMDVNGNISGPGILEFYNEPSYPGRLPEPVTLVGPADGSTVDPNGAVFSCEVSENAVGYQLLFGPDPQHVDYLVSDSNQPPTEIISDFYVNPTYWTIKARDEYGTTIHADPIYFYPQEYIPIVENITRQKQYYKIQYAIDEAKGGEVIVAYPGIHKENITFNGKNIKLRSVDPNDAAIVALTIIDGNDLGTVVTFENGEDADCIIEGLTITDGNRPDVPPNDYYGAGIYCPNSSPTISKCVIKNNKGNAILGYGSNSKISNCIIANNTTDQPGGAIYSMYGDMAIENCTIVNNSAFRGGGGVMVSFGNPTIKNSIVWGNSPEQIYDAGTASTIIYNDVQGGYTGGTGNIDADPCFVSGSFGDYYLSQIASGQLVDSPCVDAGSDTAVNLGMDIYSTRTDRAGDEGMVDMGYHYPRLSLEGIDLNGDGGIDGKDFAILADQWQKAPGVPSADIEPSGGNGVVNGKDLRLLVDHWLVGK